MKKYILTYNYVGEYETIIQESSSLDYLKHKVSEYSSLAEKNIEYNIYELIKEGVEEYEDEFQ